MKNTKAKRIRKQAAKLTPAAAPIPTPAATPKPAMVDATPKPGHIWTGQAVDPHA
jgi:hypothetical protein